MMQQISNEEDEKTRHTRMLLRCYGDSVEANNKLLERARSSSEELDMADFIQVDWRTSNFKPSSFLCCNFVVVVCALKQQYVV